MENQQDPLCGVDFYRLLGVSPRATIAEITRAHRKKQLIHHPDKGGDAEISKLLNKAYKTLTDSELRKDFDEEYEENFDDHLSTFQNPLASLGEDGGRFSDSCRRKVETLEREYNNGNVGRGDPPKTDYRQLATDLLATEYCSLKKRRNDFNEPPTHDVIFCDICDEYFSSDSFHFDTVMRPYLSLFLDAVELMPLGERFQSLFGTNVDHSIIKQRIPSKSIDETVARFWSSHKWKKVESAEAVVESCILAAKDVVMDDVTFQDTEVKACSKLQSNLWPDKLRDVIEIKLEMCRENGLIDPSVVEMEVNVVPTSNIDNVCWDNLPKYSIKGILPGFHDKWECELCNTPLGWVSNKRHHCRRCGCTTCESCRRTDLPIWSCGFSKGTSVCQKCVELESLFNLKVWLQNVTDLLNASVDENTAIHRFKVYYKGFNPETKILRDSEELVVLTELVEEKKMWGLVIVLQQFRTSCPFHWIHLARTCATDGRMDLAAECILRAELTKGVEWLDLAVEFKGALDISAHCLVMAEGKGVTASQLCDVAESMFDSRNTDMCHHYSGILIGSVKSSTTDRNTVAKNAVKWMGKPSTRELGCLTFNKLTFSKAEVQQMACTLHEMGEWTMLTHLYLYLAHKYGKEAEEFATMLSIIPTSSLTIIHAIRSQTHGDKLQSFCLSSLEQLLQREKIECLLELGVFLRMRFPSDRFWMDLATEKVKQGKCSQLITLLSKLKEVLTMTTKHHWDFGNLLFNNEGDIEEANVCFRILGNYTPLEIAEKYYVNNDHKAAIIFYIMGSGSEDETNDKLLAKGKELVATGDRPASLLYFAQLFDRILTREATYKIPMLTRTAISVSDGNLSPLLLNLFQTIVAECPHSILDREFEEMHTFMITTFLQNPNPTLLDESHCLGAIHIFPGGWKKFSKSEFSTQFAPLMTARVNAALDSYSLSQLGDILPNVNVRNGIGLRKLLRTRYQNPGNLSPPVKLYYYLLEGTILKIEGNVRGALQSWQKSLVYAPYSGGVESVSDILSNLIGFHLHLSALQEAYDELLNPPRRDVLNFPPVLHNYNFLLNFKGKQRLVTIRKVEAAIGRMTGADPLFEAGMSYLDLSSAVEDGMSLICCWMLAVTKFVLYTRQQGVSDGRKYAVRKVINEWVEAIHLLSQRLGTPWSEGSYATWLLAATGEDTSPPLVKRLILARLGSMEVNPFTLLASSNNVLSILDTLVLSSLQMEFQSFFFNHKFTTKGSTSDLIRKYVFAYHQFDGVWRGWIDGDFNEAKASCMELLLENQGYRMEDAVVNARWEMQPRAEDGWKAHSNKTKLLLPKESDKWVSFEGFSFDTETGAVHFLLKRQNLFTKLFFKTKDLLITMDDITEICHHGISGAFFTLEEPTRGDGCPPLRYHPFQEMRYFPKNLDGTHFLATMTRADLILKELTTGVEISAVPPFAMKDTSESLLPFLPDAIADLLKPIEHTSIVRDSVHRFWIQFDDIPFSTTEEDSGSKSTFIFGKVTARLLTRPMFRNAEDELEDGDEDNDSEEAKFAEKFTENYDAIGEHFPEFLRLKELMKISLMCRILMGYASQFTGLLEETKKPSFYDQQLAKVKQVLREVYQKVGDNYPLVTEAKIQEEMASLFRKHGVSSHSLTWSQKQELETKIRDAWSKAERELKESISSQLASAFGVDNNLNLQTSVHSWLCSGNSESLAPSLSTGSVRKQRQRFERVLKSLDGIGIMAKKEGEEQEELVVDETKCRWVPAAFKKFKEPVGRSVYGGVSMLANGVQVDGIKAASGTRSVAPPSGPPSSTPTVGGQGAGGSGSGGDGGGSKKKVEIIGNLKPDPRLPIPAPHVAGNGFAVHSNPKHTPSCEGYGSRAGVEPRHSRSLFETSVALQNDLKARYTRDGDGTIHRFYHTGDGLYHWSGSTGDVRSPLKLDNGVKAQMRKAFGWKLK